MEIDYSEAEEALIFKLHEQLGNKWSMIAAKLPGRTDNEIKNNYWHTKIKTKRTKQQQNQTPSGRCFLYVIRSKTASATSIDNQTGAHESATSNCIDAFLQQQSIAAVVSPESTLSSNTSSSAKHSSSSTSSSLNHEAQGSAVHHHLADQDIVMVSSSETMIFDQEYYSAGDFWTKPFLQDDICMESDIISSSSSDLLSYDQSMDLFYQFMPTPQEDC